MLFYVGFDDGTKQLFLLCRGNGRLFYLTGRAVDNDGHIDLLSRKLWWLGILQFAVEFDRIDKREVDSMDILKAIAKYLLEALPQIVTIISIVVAAIVQVGASKRETTRTIESYKQMLETERIKSEEARKAVLLERQLSEQKDNYFALSKLYAEILDDFYPASSKTLAVSACRTIYAKAMKMMGYCSPESDLYSNLEALTNQLYEDVINTDNAKPADCNVVQSWIRSIAYHLHEMTISHSSEQGTLLMKQTEE